MLHRSLETPSNSFGDAAAGQVCGVRVPRLGAMRTTSVSTCASRRSVRICPRSSRRCSQRSRRRRSGSSTWREDVADLAGGAIGGIELAAALEELGEFCFERSELASAFADLAELGLEERVDVAAWGGAVVADVDDAGDLGEGQAGCLCVADEAEPGDSRVVVDPVSVRCSFWFGEQAFAFVEADRSRRHIEFVSNLSDQHDRMLPLDLLL